LFITNIFLLDFVCVCAVSEWDKRV